MARRFACFLLAGVLVAVWLAPALAYQERVLVAMTEGSCTLRVETDDQFRTLRLRVLPEPPTCTFSATSVHSVLGEALAQAAKEQPAKSFTSLFLGRLVDYPWLSQALATFASTDSRWDTRKGRPVSGYDNGYVRDVLARPGMLAPIDQVLGDSDYRVRAVEVEKVLVLRCRDLPSRNGGHRCAGKVPFDAMVWLLLAKENAAGGGANQEVEQEFSRD